MVINNNLSALSSSDNLNANQARLTKSLARISSGFKLPTDDAAGMAVGTKMDAQIHRINGAKSNVSNATSFVQTQDGYLCKIAKALDRMSELSILAMDATKSDNDRALYNKEFGELQSYIATNADKEFNGVSLFSGNSLDVTIDSEGGSFSMAGIDVAVAPYSAVSSPSAKAGMQLSELNIMGGTIAVDTVPPTSVAISPNDTLQQVFDRIHAAVPALTASLNEATGLVTLTNEPGGPTLALTETGTDFLQKTNMDPSGAVTLAAGGFAQSTGTLTPTGMGIGTVAAAKASLAAVKLALAQVGSDRATIGSYQSRLSYSADQLTISKQNLTAASSHIQDVDVADESTEYARANIMVQSATAMLAQANQLPQSVLRLLQ
jgi:flagellin